jgi:hypothetical protein
VSSNEEKLVTEFWVPISLKESQAIVAETSPLFEKNPSFARRARLREGRGLHPVDIAIAALRNLKPASSAARIPSESSPFSIKYSKSKPVVSIKYSKSKPVISIKYSKSKPVVAIKYSKSKRVVSISRRRIFYFLLQVQASRRHFSQLLLALLRRLYPHRFGGHRQMSLRTEPR